MIQGTTPTHTFTIGINPEMVDELEIYYEQKGKLICTKRLEDCTVEGNTYIVKLTQKETLSFNDKDNVCVQARVKTTGGDVLATYIRQIRAHRLLSGEEI